MNLELEYDESTGTWKEREESFASIECPTEEDYERLVRWIELGKKVDSGECAPVVRARWKESDYGSYICSKCGCEWFFPDGTPKDNGAKHCPQCGARMDGDQQCK